MFSTLAVLLLAAAAPEAQPEAAEHASASSHAAASPASHGATDADALHAAPRAATDADDTHAAHETHAPHANHVALFVGATTLLSHAGEAPPFTLGIDYVRALPVLEHRLGVGALVDLAFGHEREVIVAPLVAFRVFEGLQLAVAPGLAMAGGHRELVARGNVSYAWHAAGLSLGPSLSVDRFPHHWSAVYGLAVGAGF